MAKISNQTAYPEKTTLDGTEFVVITDPADNNKTKTTPVSNFTGGGTPTPQTLTNNFQSTTTKIGEITLQAGVYDIHRIMVEITDKADVNFLFNQPDTILGNGATAEEIVMVTDIYLLDKDRVLRGTNLYYSSATNNIINTHDFQITRLTTDVLYLVFEYVKKGTLHN